PVIGAAFGGASDEAGCAYWFARSARSLRGRLCGEERVVEASGDDVVRVLALCPRSGCTALGAAQPGVVEQATQGRGDRGAVVGTANYEPGLAVDHRLAGPAAVARHLRHAARRRLEEHDAEALLLEAAPSVAAQHGEGVAAPVERRKAFVVDPAQQSNRCRTAPDEALEAGPVPAAAGDGHGEVRACRRQASGRL